MSDFKRFRLILEKEYDADHKVALAKNAKSIALVPVRGIIHVTRLISESVRKQRRVSDVKQCYASMYDRDGSGPTLR